MKRTYSFISIQRNANYNNKEISFIAREMGKDEKDRQNQLANV